MYHAAQYHTNWFVPVAPWSWSFLQRARCFPDGASRLAWYLSKCRWRMVLQDLWAINLFPMFSLLPNFWANVLSRLACLQNRSLLPCKVANPVTLQGTSSSRQPCFFYLSVSSSCRCFHPTKAWFGNGARWNQRYWGLRAGNAGIWRTCGWLGGAHQRWQDVHSPTMAPTLSCATGLDADSPSQQVHGSPGSLEWEFWPCISWHRDGDRSFGIWFWWCCPCWLRQRIPSGFQRNASG